MAAAGTIGGTYTREVEVNGPMLERRRDGV